MPQTILEMKNLHKAFRKTKVLQGVDMCIKKGEIYGLIGPNGSGKTTIMKTITSLIKADQGNITLFGKTDNIGYQNSLRRVASVIEKPIAFSNLTVYQNLLYAVKCQGVVDVLQIEELLSFFGLSDTKNRMYKKLSLGMKQKTAIATALISSPDFLILDEPANGLDPAFIAELRALLLRINKEKNVTMLISSHLLFELYMIATKFGIMKNGRIIREISKEELDDLHRESILIETKDVSAAVLLIKEKISADFKIVAEDKIRLFNTCLLTETVNTLLVENGISVHGINSEKVALEDFFLQTISEGKE